MAIQLSAQSDHQTCSLPFIHVLHPVCSPRRTVVALLLDAMGPLALPTAMGNSRPEFPFSSFRSVVDYFIPSEKPIITLGIASAPVIIRSKMGKEA